MFIALFSLSDQKHQKPSPLVVTMTMSNRFLLLVVIVCSLYCHAFVVHKPTTKCSNRHDAASASTTLRSAVVGTAKESEYISSSYPSFTDKLLDCLHRNDTSPITVQAYVISKRSLGKQLVFADFQLENGDLCQAMLRQEYYQGPNYAGYRRCLLKGAKLEVTGIASPTRNPGNVVLLIESMQLMAVPRQVQHIQSVLQQAREGSLPMEQVSKACCYRETTTLAELLSTGPSTEASEHKQWLKSLAKDIFASLPEDPHYPQAADQVEISKRGNFVVQSAPEQWRVVPKDVRKSTRATSMMMEMDSIEQALTITTLDDPSELSVSVNGWVQNRRRFDGNITMISLVDSLTLLSEDTSDVLNIATDRLLCIVHPDLLPTAAGLYQNLLAVGAKVGVTGNLMVRDDGKSIILWVTSLRLVQSSSQSVTIRQLLDLFHDNQQLVEVEEVAEALLLPYAEANQILSMDATERQWKANQLAVHLQQAQTKSVVKPELLEVMEKYKHYSKLHPVIPTEINNAREELSSSTSLLPARTTTTNNNNNKPIIPVGMPGTKWQSKKRPQLEWMGAQIRLVIESHPDYGQRKLSILDIGGGKGSLANYLGQAVDNVQVHVVDICAGAVANGAQKAKRLQLPVEFTLADAASTTIADVPADVVVALHACGHLSDVALSHAMDRRAGFVIVPCCFNSNPHLTIPPHGTSVPDWLGIPAEDWLALKLLAEVQGDIPLASQAIAILCAVRAEAVQNQWSSANIEIKSFPIQYSTRNTVLVGMCS